MNKDGIDEGALFTLINRGEEYDRNARGEIIYCAILIENGIEQIIAEHFCTTVHKPLFISLMFTVGQVTFSQKLTILKKLLKDSYPDLLHMFPKMFNELEKLRELRNKLAHTRVRPKDEEVMKYLRGEIDKPEEGITLEYFKDGKVITEFIDIVKIGDVFYLSRTYLYVLSIIQMEVRNRTKDLRNINLKIAIRNLQREKPYLFKS